MKNIRIFWGIFAAAAVLSLTGCTVSTRTRSTAYVDDLYGTHDRGLLAELDRREAQVAQAQAEARAARLQAQVSEAEHVRLQRESEVAADPYARLLVEDYESAYERRLRGFNSPTYHLPSSYTNFKYTDEYFYAQGYNPDNYNVVVMGDEVWVEPKYITAMFGNWGGTPYYNFSFGFASMHPRTRWSIGWNYGWSSWGYPYNYYGYNGWGDPWWSWNYGWGWGYGWNYWGPSYYWPHHYWHHPPHHGWNRPGYGGGYYSSNTVYRRDNYRPSGSILNRDTGRRTTGTTGGSGISTGTTVRPSQGTVGSGSYSRGTGTTTGSSSSTTIRSNSNTTGSGVSTSPSTTSRRTGTTSVRSGSSSSSSPSYSSGSSSSNTSSSPSYNSGSSSSSRTGSSGGSSSSSSGASRSSGGSSSSGGGRSSGGR